MRGSAPTHASSIAARDFQVWAPGKLPRTQPLTDTLRIGRGGQKVESFLHRSTLPGGQKDHSPRSIPGNGDGFAVTDALSIRPAKRFLASV